MKILVEDGIKWLGENDIESWHGSKLLFRKNVGKSRIVGV